MLPVEIVVCADIVDDTIVAKTANKKTRVKRQCQSEGAIQYLPAHKILKSVDFRNTAATRLERVGVQQEQM